MHVVLGGTGHVGSALAETLLERNEPVTVVTHDDSKKAEWERKGARVAVADVHDANSLREVFRRGKRLFLLNPPAAPSTDTDAEERRSLTSILAAVDGSGLEKIVAESTYGAQSVERAGDLGILYDMERALAAQSIPASVIRAAYYMSNWDASLATARDEGAIRTFYPADFELPMVAPRDLGRFAARLMTEAVDRTGTFYVEGPERYSSADVAAAFAAALGTPVETKVTPRDEWVETFESLGFSRAAAESYAKMTALTLDGTPEAPDAPVRGETSLERYVADLVRRDDAR